MSSHTFILPWKRDRYIHTRLVSYTSDITKVLEDSILKLVSFWTEKGGSWLCLPVPKCSVLFLILTLSQYLLIKLTKLFRLTSSLQSKSVLSSLCRGQQLVLNYCFHSRMSPVLQLSQSHSGTLALLREQPCCEGTVKSTEILQQSKSQWAVGFLKSCPVLSDKVEHETCTAKCTSPSMRRTSVGSSPRSGGFEERLVFSKSNS